MKKILIIEDEVNLGDTLVQKLTGAGYAVTLERDGLAGFNAIKKVMPDLILTDINLNFLNGFEILARKHQDPDISPIPIIILSNSIAPFSTQQLKTYNAERFIDKSKTTPAEILVKINEFFETYMVKKEHLKDKHILVVEDDTFLQSIVATRLKSDGANVSSAVTGEAALEEVKKQIPDLILLDVLLPGIDGFEVLKRIREEEATKKLPVIIISNFNQQTDKEKAAGLGADFLVKALVTPDQIITAIEKALEQKV